MMETEKPTSMEPSLQTWETNKYYDDGCLTDVYTFRDRKSSRINAESIDGATNLIQEDGSRIKLDTTSPDYCPQAYRLRYHP